jgi:hypothetical protein
MASSERKTWFGFRPAVAWIALLLAVTFGGLGKAPAATIHYIAANGADSNRGTSKTTPWLHLPGMVGCSNNCSRYTPVAGDQFILRGGDSWVNANFPITWTWSGSSGNPIYIGVDQTWYTGSAWTRPVFDAGGQAISGSFNLFIKLWSQTYVTIDNIEMRNFYWDGVGSYGQLGYLALNGSDYITLNHLYLHAWTHHDPSDGTTDTNCMIVLGDTHSYYDANTVFENGVIQNADGDNDSCYGFYAWSNLENSVIHDAPNGALFASQPVKIISGNLVYNITTSFGGVHENAFEMVGSGTNYVYNNVIHDVTIGESLMLGNTGETDYVWNNVFYNIGSAAPPRYPQSTGETGINMYYWNNTIVTGRSISCFTWSSGHGGIFGTVAIQNNHCITTGSNVYDTGFPVTTLTVDHNVLQTAITATSEGYTSGGTYAYSPSPTSPTSSTLNAGTAICEVEETCTGNLAALASDTTYACTQQTLNGVVESVCPARKVVSRPASGAWSVGAYQSALPVAPSGLTGVVH